MVAPALIAAGSAIASKAPAVLGAIKGGFGAIGSKLGTVGNLIKGKLGSLGSGGLLDSAFGFGSGAINNAAYEHFAQNIANKMGNALEARAEKYDQKLQNQFNKAEPQFQEEANTQLPELQNLINDIATQNTETQRGDLRRINAILAQQGVRGGQAGILANRAMGETSRDTLRDINKLAYDEAANRQQSRLNYYSNKAMTPWSAMSNAYGHSLIGANNALSNAQGSVYQNAYNAMLNKRGGGRLIG